MKSDKEFEMLLNEIPHAASLNIRHQQERQTNNTHHQQHQYHLHGHGYGGYGFSPNERTNGVYGRFDDDPSSHQHKYQPPSPVSGFTLQSEGSSSSLVSGWYSSDDGDRSPRLSFMDEIKPQTPFLGNPYTNGLWSESKSPDDSPLGMNSVESLMRKMSIGNEVDELLINRPFPGGFQINGYSPVRTDNGNVEEVRGFENYWSGFPDSRRVSGSWNSFNERRSELLGLQQNLQMGNLPESRISPIRYGSLFSGSAQCANQNSFSQKHSMVQDLINHQLRGDACPDGNYYDMGIGVPHMSPVLRPSLDEASLYRQQNPAYSIGHESVSNILGSRVTQRKMPPDIESSMHFSLPTVNGRRQATICNPPPQMGGALKLEAYNCEDSIIIQGKGLQYVLKKRRGRSKDHRIESDHSRLKERRPELSDQFCSIGRSVVNCENGGSHSMYSSPFPQNHSFLDVSDYVYLMSKDQHGCRYLQQKIEQGSPTDKQMIFQEIIDHVVELMTNPFGNYLVQKLLESCNADQRMKILFMVTCRPGELVRISLNMHGTRAVQKLISSLNTKEEKSIVISALEPGFLNLIKDLNGNHVLQHCLQHLPTEENKFIFKAAAKFCFEISTHRHGCCVLQRCIASATGEDREILVSKVSSNGFRLAQDAFGNYVIQFVLELNMPSVNATLMSQFEGKYVLLSTQKFSSNVIEKCLKLFREEDRAKIVNELILSSQFEKLLQDPYANYVIQSALRSSKGRLYNKLVEAIHPYAEALKSNPYGKKIFSTMCSKK